MTDAATLEERMDDVRAVMDAAGSERAAIFGSSEGGPMALLFAATYPERVSSLILYGSYAKAIDGDDYDSGVDAGVFEYGIEMMEAESGEIHAHRCLLASVTTTRPSAPGGAAMSGSAPVPGRPWPSSD